MRMLTYTVTPADEGRAIRSVVPRRFQLGAHAFRRLKVQGGVRVNGEPARADRILHAGETWTIEGAEGKTFSIIAIAPNTEISEHGLEWELDHSPLGLLADTGISNVVRRTATIQTHTGTAIAYLYK